MLRAIKTIFSFMFKRLFLVAIIIIGQMLLLAVAILFASQEAFYAYIFFHSMSFVVVMFIVGSKENPSYKITWIIAILLLPLVGGFFYVIFGNKRLPRRMRSITSRSINTTRDNMPPNQLEDKLWESCSGLALQCSYLYNMSGYPAWQDHFSEYYPSGEEMFGSMLRELEKAQRYIFLEYFIVAPGEMWNQLFAVLRKKAAAGVEVRFMYDDLGSINKIPRGFDKAIRQAGIKLCAFNPFRPHMHPVMNHRDHRKLCLIDGTSAFCGGINIADEYINRHQRLGHWKDTGVLIKGPAVWGFVFMFLQLWELATGQPANYEHYRAEFPAQPPPDATGFVQVFGDSPLDRVSLTQTAYHNILSRATKYVYITSPYLVIDHTTEVILCAAAQSGIDVRIITPYQYDRWYIHNLTRSHYATLISAGVRIYEYSPGFMHAKSYVSDDKVCMVGTSNMDFRSLYLHFECSAAFYDSPTVLQVRDDFLRCIEDCREITLEQCSVALPVRALRAMLKLFAPLL